MIVIYPLQRRRGRVQGDLCLQRKKLILVEFELHIGLLCLIHDS